MNFDGSTLDWLPSVGCVYRGKIVNLEFPISDRPGPVFCIHSMRQTKLGIKKYNQLKWGNKELPVPSEIPTALH